jgi:phosphatidate cytidylyltransferase
VPELLVRVLFAVLAIPLTLWIVLTGGQIFRAFCMLLLLGGGIELYLMTRKRGTPLYLPAALIGIALFGLRSSALFVDCEKWIFPVIFSVLFLLTIREVIRADIEAVFARAGATLLAVFYIGFLGSYLISITELALHPQMGRLGLIALLLSVWSSDTFAFFIGKYLGKRPLAPLVSPHKTVEGLLGAGLGGLAGMLVGRTLFEPDFPSAAVAAVIGLAVGLAGQAGDLFESLLKRSCGVKDSSRVFPGHGGILDRIDALIFAAPVYFYLMGILA